MKIIVAGRIAKKCSDLLFKCRDCAKLIIVVVVINNLVFVNRTSIQKTEEIRQK